MSGGFSSFFEKFPVFFGRPKDRSMTEETAIRRLLTVLPRASLLLHGVDREGEFPVLPPPADLGQFVRIGETERIPLPFVADDIILIANSRECGDGDEWLPVADILDRNHKEFRASWLPGTELVQERIRNLLRALLSTSSFMVYMLAVVLIMTTSVIKDPFSQNPNTLNCLRSISRTTYLIWPSPVLHITVPLGAFARTKIADGTLSGCISITSVGHTWIMYGPTTWVP